MKKLRYFLNPRLQRLVLSPRAVGGLLEEKPQDVENVIHHDSPSGWLSALNEAIENVRHRLVRGLWGGFALAFWSLLALGLYWWVPLGLQGKWGRAYWVPAALPVAAILLSFLTVFKSVSWLRRLPQWTERVKTGRLRMARSIPCPITLIPESETVKASKLSVLIGLISVLIFVTIVGRLAVPFLTYDAVIHHGGAISSTSQIEWKPLTAWWELSPRFVSGKAYGPIYYHESLPKILVLSIEYKLDNRQHLAPSEVEDYLQAWAYNLSVHYMQVISGGVPTGSSPEEEMNFYCEILEEPEFKEVVEKQIKEGAKEMFGSQFLRLEIEFKKVAFEDYISHVRRD